MPSPFIPSHAITSASGASASRADVRDTIGSRPCRSHACPGNVVMGHIPTAPGCWYVGTCTGTSVPHARRSRHLRPARVARRASGHHHGARHGGFSPCLSFEAVDRAFGSVLFQCPRRLIRQYMYSTSVCISHCTRSTVIQSQQRRRTVCAQARAHLLNDTQLQAHTTLGGCTP